MKSPPPSILSPDELKEAAGLLRRYFAAELDQELGQLPAEMMIDHLTTTIGRQFYNRGLRDAESLLRSKVEDIADALYGMER